MSYESDFNLTVPRNVFEEILNSGIKLNQVEYLLHQKYKDKRYKGEWFKLDEIDILSIKDILSSTAYREEQSCRMR